MRDCEVKQGALGDCWLIGAFACLADFPGHLEMLFEPSVVSPDGRYVVHLFHSNGWRRVEIDDLVPCKSLPIPRSFALNYRDIPCPSPPYFHMFHFFWRLFTAGGGRDLASPAGEGYDSKRAFDDARPLRRWRAPTKP